ncbi:unnamed protein product, partial [Meganyctiphanes norvegica]
MHIQSIFNTDYFKSQLEDIGALKKCTAGNDDQKTLVKVPYLTVGLVLAAKTLGTFSDSDIVKWIRKGRKVTPTVTEQLMKYNELADYLMNEVEEVDANKWKDILNKTLYIWPSAGNKDNWSKIFGDKTPEICKKIDNKLKIKGEPNKLKIKGEPILDKSAELIKKEVGEGCIPKEEMKIEKSEDLKLKSENEKKEEIKDVESSEDKIKDESDKSSLCEVDDQLDFLFNEDEELDYEDEELDYEYDITNGRENEELNEDDVKQFVNNENETENIEQLDSEPVNSHEGNQSNIESSNTDTQIEDPNEDPNEDDEFNFDNLVVVDAEGDSDENESDAKTDDEGGDEDSRDWRYSSKSSNNRDKSKSTPKDKDFKNISKDTERERLPDRFEKIVVITDKLYKEFVAPLNIRNEKVVLIADDELTMKNLPGILERNKHKGDEKSLWIIVTGMYDLIKIKDMEKLKKMYIPHVDNIEVKKFSVSSIIKEGKEMRRTIKSSLGATCAVVSCPPIPAALLVNQKDSMKELSYDIGRFTKEWTRMAREFFEQQRLTFSYKKRGQCGFLNSMHNVGGIHQIRFGRDDRLDLRNPSWKMLLSWYEIIEGIIRFNVIRDPSKSESSRSKRKCDDKSTSRSESTSRSGSTRREKSDLETTPKKQSNSSEKENNKEGKDETKEVKDTNASVVDDLILRESIELSDDLLVVVIGEEKAARNFCKMKIPNVRFKIVVIRNGYYRDINKLIPGNHLKAANILWVVLFDVSRLYSNKNSFCKRFFSRQRCKDELFFATQLSNIDVSRKCTRISEFSDDIMKNFGKNSFVFLAPVIPQTVLHCYQHENGVNRTKIAEFHEFVHQTKELKDIPIFRPATDKEDIIRNYNFFEKEWLKVIENVMRKQNLNFEFIGDYEKKKGKVVDVLTEPRKYRPRTDSYEEWEGFMEALIITFTASVCVDDGSKENKNLKSEKAEEEKVTDDEIKVDSESQKNIKVCDSSDVTLPNQIYIERISDDLKNEDFEKILRVCGEFSDIKYKKRGTLFLFREAQVTFVNANSVFNTFRLLNGKYFLSSKLSVEVINKDNYSKEVCENKDEEFEKKAADTICDILKSLRSSMVKDSNKEVKEKTVNKHKDYKQERQNEKLSDVSKDKENKNSRSSNVADSNLKRKSGEIESKEGDQLKSPKSMKTSSSSERKKRSSKSPEKQHRTKSPDRNKRSRSIENKKSRASSPDRKRSRTDKLRDNEIQFTNINNDNREILRVLSHFLSRFGGSKIRLEKSDERIIFKFIDRHVAKLLCRFLNDFRFPDKHLKVVTSEDKNSEVNNADLQFVAKHLDLVLKNMPHFADYLDEVHSLWPGAFNLFTFKAKKCLKNHPIDGALERKLCINFHGFTDSRRDPRHFDYEAEICPESWKSKKAKKLVCPDGKDCKFSHTTMERVFHMSTLQKNVCMEWYPTQSCNANRFCAEAHP